METTTRITTVIETPSPWMTRAEAAKFLRVTDRTIDRYSNAGKLTKCRVEGLQSVRFARAEVEGLVVGQEYTAGGGLAEHATGAVPVQAE